MLKFNKTFKTKSYHGPHITLHYFIMYTIRYIQDKLFMKTFLYLEIKHMRCRMEAYGDRPNKQISKKRSSGISCQQKVNVNSTLWRLLRRVQHESQDRQQQ